MGGDDLRTRSSRRGVWQQYQGVAVGRGGSVSVTGTHACLHYLSSSWSILTYTWITWRTLTLPIRRNGLGGPSILNFGVTFEMTIFLPSVPGSADESPEAKITGRNDWCKRHGSLDLIQPIQEFMLTRRPALVRQRTKRDLRHAQVADRRAERAVACTAVLLVGTGRGAGDPSDWSVDRSLTQLTTTKARQRATPGPPKSPRGGRS